MKTKNSQDLFNYLGLKNYFNKKIWIYYIKITKDIYKNFFNINKSNTYKNDFSYKNIIKYYAISFFIACVLFLFLPLSIFGQLNGSISIAILFIKSFAMIGITSIFISLFVLLIKRQVMFKEILLTYLLIQSLILPIFSLLSLPIFFYLDNLQIEFFIGGGGESAIPQLNSDNLHFLLYSICVNFFVPLISGTILPIIWLFRTLKLNVIIVFIITQVSGTIAAKILVNINPLILNATLIVDKIISFL